MGDLFRSAFKNLGRKRVRTSLTMLGISIGVASVILIGNISQCGTDALTTEMDSLGLSGLSISAAPGNTGVLLSGTDLDLVRRSSSVEQAMPLMMQTTDMKTKRVSSKALLWGIDSDASHIISLNVLFGRSISSMDVKSSSNVCLVDENFSKSAYGRSNIIGKNVSILCAGILEDFQVVGVVKTGSGLLQNLIGDYIPTFVYIPYTTMQDALGKDYFDQIAVKVKPGTNVDAAGASLTSSLDRSNSIANGFVSNNLVKQKDGLTNILGMITLILSAVGAISLLVASLSIMTVMLVSVNERTREIGIKKSIGARRRDILFEFLLEALLITVIGSVIGVAAGYGLSFLGAIYLHVTLGLRWDIMILTVGFALLTGVVFGVYPAFKASNLKPVDALRME